MSDIVERLRSIGRAWSPCIPNTYDDAADEIERLRAEFSAVLGDAITKDAEVGAADALANRLRADLAAERAEVERLRHALGEAHMNLAMFYPEGGKPGDRIVDGGRMGTIVTCPTCDGDGILHDPDEKPEPSTPEGGLS